MFVHFSASSDKTEFAGPADCQVIGREGRGVAEMRVPAFPGANEQDAIPGVFNYVAAIVEMQSKFLILGRRSRKDHVQIIGSPRTALLQAKAFVLKKRQWLAMISGNAVYSQSTRKLESQGAGFAVFRAELNRCARVERVVGENRRLQGIVESAKS